MSARYFMKKIEECTRCEGKQFVQHPAWTEYWKVNADKQPMSVEEDVKWFEDHGWYRGSCMDIRSDVLPELLNEIDKRKLQVT